jgi:hypothetical protein
MLSGGPKYRGFSLGRQWVMLKQQLYGMNNLLVSFKSVVMAPLLFTAPPVPAMAFTTDATFFLPPNTFERYQSL